MKKCYYDILEVDKNASFKDIKKSYRKLVVKYHPDKHSNSDFYNEKIKEINIAYECLSDQQKRKNYDLKFSFNTPPSHNHTSQYQSPDLYTVKITFEESYFGCFKQIKLIDLYGKDYFYTLQIPGGISDKSVFTIKGNSKVADFLVKLIITPSDVFLREGQDLYYEAVIPFIKLLTGGVVEIPWFGQTRTLNLRPNTPESYVFTIPEMGMPYPGTPGKVGNLFIKLKVKGMVDFSEALKECFV